MKNIKMLGLFLVMLSVPVCGTAGVSDAQVLYTGTYGDGRLFVALDKTITEPGCDNTRFDVQGSNAQIKTWLSIALTSATSGKKISVGTNGCFGPYPTLTNDNSSYFYLKNE